MDLERLVELNPEALLFEPREVFDAALVGITDEPKDHWPRAQPTWVAVYDEDRCIQAVMHWLGCGYGEALDYYSYNTLGAWVGENTPTIVSSEDADGNDLG